MSRFLSRLRGQSAAPTEELITLESGRRESGKRSKRRRGQQDVEPADLLMSGTNEALWFAPAGDYAPGGEEWDPLGDDTEYDDGSGLDEYPEPNADVTSNNYRRDDYSEPLRRMQTPQVPAYFRSASNIMQNTKLDQSLVPQPKLKDQRIDRSYKFEDDKSKTASESESYCFDPVPTKVDSLEKLDMKYGCDVSNIADEEDVQSKVWSFDESSEEDKLKGPSKASRTSIRTIPFDDTIIQENEMIESVTDEERNNQELLTILEQNHADLLQARKRLIIEQAKIQSEARGEDTKDSEQTCMKLTILEEDICAISYQIGRCEHEMAVKREELETQRHAKHPNKEQDLRNDLCILEQKHADLLQARQAIIAECASTKVQRASKEANAKDSEQICMMLANLEEQMLYISKQINACERDMAEKREELDAKERAKGREQERDLLDKLRILEQDRVDLLKVEKTILADCEKAEAQLKSKGENMDDSEQACMMLANMKEELGSVRNRIAMSEHAMDEIHKELEVFAKSQRDSQPREKDAIVLQINKHKVFEMEMRDLQKVHRTLTSKLTDATNDDSSFGSQESITKLKRDIECVQEEMVMCEIKYRTFLEEEREQNHVTKSATRQQDWLKTPPESIFSSRATLPRTPAPPSGYTPDERQPSSRHTPDMSNRQSGYPGDKQSGYPGYSQSGYPRYSQSGYPRYSQSGYPGYSDHDKSPADALQLSGTRKTMEPAFTIDEYAQLGALPRILPQKKAHLEELSKELLSLQAQITDVQKAVNVAHVHSEPPGIGTAQNNNQNQTESKSSLDITDRVAEADMEGVRSRRDEINFIYTPLQEEVITIEKDLQETRRKIANDPVVKRARRRYKKERTKFVNQIFTSILHGNIQDVAILTAALDLEGEKDCITLENIIQPASNLSVIHLALMKGRQDIVEFLVKHSGKDIAMVKVQTAECQNLTPLYIAIQHGVVENVKMLADSVPIEDNERANYINEKIPNKAYDGTPYNELPLAGSVWSSVGKDLTEMKEMLAYLVENGADLAQQTSDGNTLLHLLVVQAVESIVHLDYFRRFLKEIFSEAAANWYIRVKKAEDNREWQMSPKEAEIRGFKRLMNIRNKENLTPLALAAKVESPLYLDIINWENVMRYPDLKMGQQFSNVDTYDISNITSLVRSGNNYSYNQSSVMHVLAHNDVDLSQKAWNVDISCIEPLNSIIRHKWNLYKWFYIMWGFVHILHMIIFTWTTFHHGYTAATRNQQNGATTADPSVVSYEVVAEQRRKRAVVITTNSSGEDINSTLAATDELASGYYGPVCPGNPFFAFLLILPIAYILIEVIDLFGSGEKYEFRYSITGNAVYRILMILFSVFSIVWFVLHMVQNVNQDMILSVALLFGWIFCIFFTRTIHFPSKNSQIGAFSIMVQRMLFHDLTPFFLISFFILLAFSTALHATFLHTKHSTNTNLHFKDTFFGMMNYFSSVEDGQGHDGSREEAFAKAVLTIYGIISVVLLINMLIAAMNKTYDMVRETHTDLVVRQRLAILLMLERRLPFQCLKWKSESGFDSRQNPRTQKWEVFLKVVSRKMIGKLVKLRRKHEKVKKA